MAGSFSNYLENVLLDHVLKNTAYTVPANLYLGWSTADPGESAGGLAEPVGNNYARALANSWSAASGRATSNSASALSNVASGSWGTLTHWSLFDAITSGNMLVYSTMTASRTITAGQALSCAIGDLGISFDAGAVSTYLANALLNHFLKTASYTVPTNIYNALSTANPGDSGSGLAEPVGNNYARPTSNGWALASGGSCANDADITFATASGAWGLCTHGALYDASTSGNLLFYGALSPNQTPVNLSVVKHVTGGFVVTLN